MTVDERASAPRRTGMDAHIDRRRILPAALAELLRAAREDERAAVGSQRRPAYLLTRNIISAALSAGFPARTVAEELGVTTESLRTRAQPGRIRLTDIALLAGLDVDRLRTRCADAGVAVDEGGIHSDDLAAILLDGP
ncbi:hypothetical protein DOE76_09585 [Leifsonia sp. ku-ls]|nr:hypothetical protein DOE76_09585 [Leifsonia sp. ku-ls]